ncbi:DUF6234 family protein [Streptomyces sp. NBRC 109706]|uniref:DUF6234 family protein n=1 Tax=Streptomyces sp. NBRC 109706 TaxID=1550035 RepID=UPI000782EE1E|nr:DUF6234 family protein [Streptomyces sp. NBRC 109706]
MNDFSNGSPGSVRRRPRLHRGADLLGAVCLVLVEAVVLAVVVYVVGISAWADSYEAQPTNDAGGRLVLYLAVGALVAGLLAVVLWRARAPFGAGAQLLVALLLLGFCLLGQAAESRAAAPPSGPDVTAEDGHAGGVACHGGGGDDCRHPGR